MASEQLKADIKRIDEELKHILNKEEWQVIYLRLNKIDISKSEDNPTYNIALLSEHECGKRGVPYLRARIRGTYYSPKILSFSTLEDIKIIFREILETKKEMLQYPLWNYSKDLLYTTVQYGRRYGSWDKQKWLISFFRSISGDNLFVIPDENLLQIFSKLGFGFDKWYSGYKSIPEHFGDDKDLELAQKILLLYYQGFKIEYRMNIIGDILYQRAMGSGCSYIPIWIFGEKRVLELADEYDESYKKIKDINEQIKTLYQQITGEEICNGQLFWYLVDSYEKRIPEKHLERIKEIKAVRTKYRREHG